MWVAERLEELNMTLDEFAEAVDRKPATVRSWIYTYERLPFRLSEKAEWLRICRALDMTILDILAKRGYELPIPHSEKHMEIVYRLEQLQEHEQEMVIQIMNGALDYAEMRDSNNS